MATMAPQFGSIGCHARFIAKAGDPSYCPDRPFPDKCRLAVVMQKLSEAKWLQAVAPLLHESVSWRVEEALRKEARGIVHHELLQFMDIWQPMLGPITLHCSPYHDYTFAC